MPYQSSPIAHTSWKLWRRCHHWSNTRAANAKLSTLEPNGSTTFRTLTRGASLRNPRNRVGALTFPRFADGHDQDDPANYHDPKPRHDRQPDQRTFKAFRIAEGPARHHEPAAKSFHHD